jgi:hypothetical protein
MNRSGEDAVQGGRTGVGFDPVVLSLRSPTSSSCVGRMDVSCRLRDTCGSVLESSLAACPSDSPASRTCFSTCTWFFTSFLCSNVLTALLGRAEELEPKGVYAIQDGCFVQAVMNEVPPTVRRYKPCVAQDAQVLRDGALGYIQAGRESPDTKRSTPEMSENLNACFHGKRTTDPCDAFRFVHPCPYLFQYLLIC